MRALLDPPTRHTDRGHAGWPRRVAIVAATLGAACSFDAERETDSVGASASGLPSGSSATSTSGPASAASDGSPLSESAANASATGESTGGATTNTSAIKFDLGASESTTGGMTTGEEECGSILHGTLRDFRQDHPDFEYVIQVDPGIVQANLGPDQKPVYAGNPTTPTTHGASYFDQWYRDVGGVNINVPIEIPLTLQNGVFTYDNPAFFPLDGQAHGNEGNPHNYHFTLEIATEFTYFGGEVFSFTGDDDLFTFINGVLAIDLGGVHGPLSGSVDLDAQAAQLGIVPGGTYSLHFFFAERHTSESNFRIDTTISCFEPPPE